MSTKADNIKQYYRKKYIEKKNIEYAKLLSNNRYINLENMIYRINNSFKYQNVNRILKFKELIGCNKTELLNYLRDNNSSNINIDSYPEWEPDHIIPICNFNLKNEDEQKKCFNYKNIQVLSKHDNRVKNKY